MLGDPPATSKTQCKYKSARDVQVRPWSTGHSSWRKRIRVGIISTINHRTCGRQSTLSTSVGTTGAAYAKVHCRHLLGQSGVRSASIEEATDGVLIQPWWCGAQSLAEFRLRCRYRFRRLITKIGGYITSSSSGEEQRYEYAVNDLCGEESSDCESSHRRAWRWTRTRWQRWRGKKKWAELRGV